MGACMMRRSGLFHLYRFMILVLVFSSQSIGRVGQQKKRCDSSTYIYNTAAATKETLLDGDEAAGGGQAYI